MKDQEHQRHTQECIAILQAHMEGRTIEVRLPGNNEWVEARRPKWDFENREFRVKPREWWINKSGIIPGPEIGLNERILVREVTSTGGPASYPPPESTWPDKPAPPEGSEWVRQPDTVTGGNVEGELLMLNEANQWWKMRDCCWEDRVVFKATPVDQELAESRQHLPAGYVGR